MKDTGTSYHGRHLKKAIEYITVSEKTQNGRLVSARLCIRTNETNKRKVW